MTVFVVVNSDGLGWVGLKVYTDKQQAELENPPTDWSTRKSAAFGGTDIFECEVIE